RIGNHKITRTPHVEIPQVVQRPLGLRISVSLVRATRTGLSLVGAPGRDDRWRWQVGNRGHPFGGIGSIRTRTAYGFVPLVRMLGPALYDTCPAGAIRKPDKDAIVSLILYGPALPAIVQSCRGHVRLPQPRLHLGNVGVVREGLGRRGG